MARIHVILDDEVLERIDRRVGPRGRSEWLEEAARNALQRDDLIEALEETSGIARGPGYEHWATPEKIREWIREGRRSRRET